MINLSDDELFEKLELKIEQDVDQSWQQAEHPPPKQVVILAGPQLSEMHLAHQFFIHHASRYRPNQRSASLSGWAWPWIDPADAIQKFLHPSLTHDRVFDLLIEFEDNEALVEMLLTEIEKTWIQDAFKGIILGSEYFDQIPDSTRIIQRILDKLGVSDPKQVTIVLSYPSSRVTQWNAFFATATQTIPMSYHDYICSPDYESSSLHRLQTSSNPLRLAQEFTSQDWTVALIDMQGLATAQQDLAHVIACRILSSTSCRQGTVVGIPVHPTNHSSTGPNVSELDALQQQELESYFADRDCFYQDTLVQDTDPRFNVLFRTNLWNNCGSNQSLAMYYEQLSEPTYLWSLIRFQVSCPNDNDSTNNTGLLVQQNIPRVTDTLQRQSLDGTKLVSITVVCALLATVFVTMRYHRARQRKPVHSDVLRMWDRSDELPSETLATTLSSGPHPVDVDCQDNRQRQVPLFQQDDLILESKPSRGVLI